MEAALIRTIAPPLLPTEDPGGSLALRTLRRGGGRSHAGGQLTSGELEDGSFEAKDTAHCLTVSPVPILLPRQ